MNSVKSMFKIPILLAAAMLVFVSMPATAVNFDQPMCENETSAQLEIASIDEIKAEIADIKADKETFAKIMDDVESWEARHQLTADDGYEPVAPVETVVAVSNAAESWPEIYLPEDDLEAIEKAMSDGFMVRLIESEGVGVGNVAVAASPPNLSGLLL